MEGVNGIKQVAETLAPVEKDLNSPIMLTFTSKIENAETPKDLSSDGVLSRDELNRPLLEPDTTETMGLSDKLKQEIQEKIGWSDNVLDYIKTEEEAHVYIEANLKEVNGNLERTNIDWNAKIPQDRIERIRSLYGDDVAGKWANKTNLDLIKDGKAPYGPDGERINLHHIGQKPDSPLAELTNTEHKQNDGVLHNKIKPSEIERPVFKSERKQYWQTRYEAIQQK